MSSFVNRIIRAAKLDVDLYKEVEADKNALGQSVGVIVLSSLATGIGSMQAGQLNLIINTLLALAGWYVWAYLTYFIGTKIMPEPQTKSDHGELLRTLGFASAPGIIRIFGVIPDLTMVVFSIADFWMLWAMVIAIRQALDYESTWRAVGVCMIGGLVQYLIIAVFLMLAGLGRG